MTAVPHLNIPLTVTTNTVAPSLKKAETEIKSSAQRMSKIKSFLTPALGAAGGGPAGGIMGSLMGAGPVGAGLMAATAVITPFMMAGKIMDSLQADVQGAGEALRNFKDSGEQSFAVNSKLLETMAAMEERMGKINQSGFWATVMAATGGDGKTASKSETMMQTMKDALTAATTYAIARLSGESDRTAGAMSRKSIAPEFMAAQTEAALQAARAADAMEEAKNAPQRAEAQRWGREAGLGWLM